MTSNPNILRSYVSVLPPSSWLTPINPTHFLVQDVWLRELIRGFFKSNGILLSQIYLKYSSYQLQSFFKVLPFEQNISVKKILPPSWYSYHSRLSLHSLQTNHSFAIKPLISSHKPLQLSSWNYWLNTTSIYCRPSLCYRLRRLPCHLWNLHSNYKLRFKLVKLSTKAKIIPVKTLFENHVLANLVTHSTPFSLQFLLKIWPNLFIKPMSTTSQTFNNTGIPEYFSLHSRLPYQSSLLQHFPFWLRMKSLANSTLLRKLPYVIKVGQIFSSYKLYSQYPSLYLSKSRVWNWQNPVTTSKLLTSLSFISNEQSFLAQSLAKVKKINSLLSSLDSWDNSFFQPWYYELLILFWIMSRLTLIIRFIIGLSPSFTAFVVSDPTSDSTLLTEYICSHIQTSLSYKDIITNVFSSLPQSLLSKYDISWYIWLTYLWRRLFLLLYSLSTDQEEFRPSDSGDDRVSFQYANSYNLSLYNLESASSNNIVYLREHLLKDLCSVSINSWDSFDWFFNLVDKENLGMLTRSSLEEMLMFIIRLCYSRYASLTRDYGLYVSVCGRLGGVDMASKFYMIKGPLQRNTFSFRMNGISRQIYTPWGTWGVKVVSR